jgi:uncharacterized membrane protein
MDHNMNVKDSEGLSFKNEEKIDTKAIGGEDMSIEALHSDLEKKLEEQGFIFDKKKFFFHDRHLSSGERLADNVAKFGGSWRFIIIFGVILASWVTVNIIWLGRGGWDPYPFILLNLILSCLASIQAPIIMMSQNRQAQKDRAQQEINLEKDIVDFKQDRLDLILDQKEWGLLKEINERFSRLEEKIDSMAPAKKPKKRSK